jgi:hypothetical protein
MRSVRSPALTAMIRGADVLERDEAAQGNMTVAFLILDLRKDVLASGPQPGSRALDTCRD